MATSQHVQPPLHEKDDDDIYVDSQVGYGSDKGDDTIDAYASGARFDDMEPRLLPDSSTQPESEDEDARRKWDDRQLKKEQRQQLKEDPRRRQQQYKSDGCLGNQPRRMGISRGVRYSQQDELDRNEEHHDRDRGHNQVNQRSIILQSVTDLLEENERTRAGWTPYGV